MLFISHHAVLAQTGWASACSSTHEHLQMIRPGVFHPWTRTITLHTAKPFRDCSRKLAASDPRTGSY